MSMSDNESLAQDTEDLEENNEKAHKENNENMDNNDLNENMDSIDFLTAHEKAHKENNEVEDSEEEEEEEKKKKMVIVMDPPKEGTTTSSDSGVVSDFLRSKKEMKWCMVLLGLRIAAALFCLISFSVLAANEQKVLVKKSIIDWYLTHEYSLDTTYSFNWHDYDEFKYSFTANILGFVYSVLQICDLLRYLITKKHTVNPKLRGYFNIAMDQALAYIIMSASSSAAATVHLYKGYWAEHGGHKFTEMANASVAMSFFAFGAFALASPVSGFILARFS